MDSNTFKSVTFGGFDKQDVVAYIERTAAEHTAALEGLQQENDALKTASGQLDEELTTLRAQAEQQSEELGQLRAELDRLRTECAALQGATEQAAQLAAQVTALQPDAEAYRQFRTRIGDIECDARKRAADLEAATHTKLRQLAADFRGKYQALVTTFDATSGYVTGELRKVEVNLSQLPRALDQVGTDLTQLESILKETPEA